MGAYGNTPEATTSSGTPAAPTNLTATAISNSQINLGWSASSGNPDNYYIYRSLISGTGFSVIDSVNHPTTSYSDTGLDSLVTYYYQVTAVNQFGESPPSNEASAMTFGNPPSAPTNLIATTASSSQIDLNWTANSGNSDMYYIYRSLTSGTGFSIIDSVDHPTTSYSDTGLIPSTTYYYKVTAVNQWGESLFSNEANATTDPGAPSAPMNLQIDLNWNASSGDPEKYCIYRSLTSGTGFSVIDTVAHPSTTYSDTGLSPSTTYFYQVTAVNQWGESPPSNEANATTTNLGSPSAPTNLTAITVSSSKIDLSWNASNGNPNKYYIYRSLTSGTGFSLIDSVDHPFTTYNDTSLDSATTYYYKVTAVNQFGESPFSNEADATTFGTPTTPMNLMAITISSSQIDLSWNASSGNPEKYYIYRSLTSGAGYSLIDSVDHPTTSYNDTLLNPSTIYYYHVTAVNQWGESLPSNEANSTTHGVVPSAPTNLTAMTVSSFQIDLSWSASSGNPSKYYIYRSLTSGTGFGIVDSVDHPTTNYSDTGLTAATAYYYEVTAVNQWGESDFSNEANATTQEEGPQIGLLQYSDFVNPNQSTEVRITVTATSGINQVQLSFRNSSTSGFTILPMQLESGDTYLASIPGGVVQEPGVEFKIRVEDNDSNSSETDLFYLGIILSNGTTNPAAQPSGSTVSFYRVFSVPLDIDNNSPQSFLSVNSALGSYDKSKYRWYGVVNGALVEYPGFGNVDPSRGFFFLSNLSNIRFNSGSGRTITTVEPFAISLPAGWSLIGSPFNFNIPFDSLSVSAGTFQLMSYEGNWSLNTSGLEPWKGYAINMSEAGNFIIKPGVAGLSQSAEIYTIANNDALNWLIRIAAETAHSKDNFNFIGQHEEAGDGFDRLDLYEPPRLPQQISVVFGNSNSSERRTVDIRRPSEDGHVWEFSFLLNPQDELLSLYFEGLNTIPSTFKVFLIDLGTRAAYPLNDKQSVEIITGNISEKQFTLVIGTEAFLNELELDVELYPTKFQLLQNYPNPFNPSTTITVLIPERSKIEVKVYNILGERVTTIHSGILEPGRHGFIWDGQDEIGNKITSGIYIYRLTTDKGKSFTRKMILLK
jgi:fibronectin type 3 domain-containing protein